MVKPKGRPTAFKHVKERKMKDCQKHIKAIQNKCLDCSRGDYKQVRECPIWGCPLFPYRTNNPPDAEQIKDSIIST